MHIVHWLDTRNDTDYERTFASYQEAEKFMMALRRKFPHSPIEYQEV